MAKKKQVRIRILPLHGIGGVGNAGDTTWMDKKEAEHYRDEGYLEILPDADEPTPSSVPEEQMTLEEAGEEQAEEADQEEPEEAGEEQAEDHKVMKPESKRK